MTDREAKPSGDRCWKCKGAGWVWGFELDDYDAEAAGPVDDTRYPCDNCEARRIAGERSKDA